MKGGEWEGVIIKKRKKESFPALASGPLFLTGTRRENFSTPKREAVDLGKCTFHKRGVVVVGWSLDLLTTLDKRKGGKNDHAQEQGECKGKAKNVWWEPCYNRREICATTYRLHPRVCPFFDRDSFSTFGGGGAKTAGFPSKARPRPSPRFFCGTLAPATETAPFANWTRTTGAVRM